jgi:hypothetical protein
LLGDLDCQFEATIPWGQVRVVDVGHGYGAWLPVQVATTSWPFSVTTQGNVDPAAADDGGSAADEVAVGDGSGAGDATGVGDPNGIGETCGPGVGVGEATAKTEWLTCGVTVCTAYPTTSNATDAAPPIKTRLMGSPP